MIYLSLEELLLTVFALLLTGYQWNWSSKRQQKRTSLFVNANPVDFLMLLGTVKYIWVNSPTFYKYFILNFEFKNFI